MGRTSHAVELATGVMVATTHLESQGEHERRIEQIEVIQRHLASRDRVIWCGDFNLEPESPEQAAIHPTWIDAWVDTDVNTMRYQLKDKTTRKRIDRVLSRGIIATAIELVGTERIDIDGTFVSDHFGLLATL